MTVTFRAIFLSLALISSAFSVKSEEHHEADSGQDIRTEIKQHIQHHLQDAHDYHLFTDESTGTHYGFPLPVILWYDGLHVFMSSAFHHGEEVVESNGHHFALHHGTVYLSDENGELLGAQHDRDHTEDGEDAHLHVKPLDLSITKNVVHILLVFGIMLFVFMRAAKSYKSGPIPTGPAKFLEPFIIFIRDEIARPNIGEKHYKKYMGFLLTVFFFIWIVNLLGLTPLGVNVTNSIAVTFSLAIMTFIITQFTAKKDYWMHIFWMPGVPVPMKILLAPIEFLGIFIKPFALMIRLYANITAGHIVMMSLLGLMFIFQNWFGSTLSFGLAFAISLLELLVAALQAYIFTMLSALYFGSAVEEHHDDH